MLIKLNVVYRGGKIVEQYFAISRIISFKKAESAMQPYAETKTMINMDGYDNVIEARETPEEIADMIAVAQNAKLPTSVYTVSHGAYTWNTVFVTIDSAQAFLRARFEESHRGGYEPDIKEFKVNPFSVRR